MTATYFSFQLMFYLKLLLIVMIFCWMYHFKKKVHWTLFFFLLFPSFFFPFWKGWCSFVFQCFFRCFFSATAGINALFLHLRKHQEICYPYWKTRHWRLVSSSNLFIVRSLEHPFWCKIINHHHIEWISLSNLSSSWNDFLSIYIF